MIKDFLISYNLRNTYRVNSIIYLLKGFPLIKKIVPSSLYKCKGLKTFANIISFIYEILSLFIGKLIYMSIFVLVTCKFYSNPSLAFTNILFFLTIIGGFTNTYLFAPSNDKFYAIILMRFNAKNYILSNYIYFIIKTFIGFLPFTIIIGSFFNVSLMTCILYPLIIILIKNIFVYTGLAFDKNNYNENKMGMITTIIILSLLAVAYGLPIINIGINESILLYLLIIIIPFSIYSIYYIFTYKKYTKLYKNILKQDNLVSYNDNKTEVKQYAKSISNVNVESDKTGYAYFNDIFIQRHKNILIKPIKMVSFSSFIIFILLMVLSLFFNKISTQLNTFLKMNIPYFLFIMYFINRGQVITKAMFMNCDHSMLTYRFYREPDAILLLFKERLKVLIQLNIIPGLIIGIGSVILLFMTGGADVLTYIILFLSIISMTIFFSVHYLVLYYLLQPYNISLEVKNPLYGAICSFTYFICYMAIRFELPVIIFGSCMIVFTIIYSLVSLILVYKHASNTFKLK